MADIFLKEDLRHLLNGKKVVFMGDSNVRSYYKDILCLFNSSEIIPSRVLASKMEKSVYGDSLNRHGEKNNSRQYQEERIFHCNGHHFEYYFLTRVYNDYVEEILSLIVGEKQPDVVIINSCLWDICRWGPKGVEEFKVNLEKLMKRFNELLEERCLVIWATCPPLAGMTYGGFLLVELDFLKYSLRFHVMEANSYARQVVVQHGYDVLDIHYHLRMHTHLRCADGIHWTPSAIRYITNLLLTHIALAWAVAPANRFKSSVTQGALDEENFDEDFVDSELASPVGTDSENLVASSKYMKKKKNSVLRKKQRFLPNHHGSRTLLPTPMGCETCSATTSHSSRIPLLPTPVIHDQRSSTWPLQTAFLPAPKVNTTWWQNTVPFRSFY